MKSRKFKKDRIIFIIIIIITHLFAFTKMEIFGIFACFFSKGGEKEKIFMNTGTLWVPGTVGLLPTKKTLFLKNLLY